MPYQEVEFGEDPYKIRPIIEDEEFYTEDNERRRWIKAYPVLDKIFRLTVVAPVKFALVLAFSPLISLYHS